MHLTKEVAHEGYLREGVLGIRRTDTHRVYRDMNHKPEVIYALTGFNVLVSFHVSRKVHQLLVGLEGDLANRPRHRLKLSAVREDLRFLVTWLFDENSPTTSGRVEEFVAACRPRLALGISPSLHTDEFVSILGEKHPDDPGITVALLVEPVPLHPGGAVYILPR